MVFSGKIYDQVKEQLDKYLFGFDKDQLDVSLLKGAIKLQEVNIKPNKAEKLLQSIQVPLSLKAGTVGQLELKLNLMSMFSSDTGSIEASLENVFFIIGPTMRVVSKDDSYLQETDAELCQSYDQNNAFNIFTNNLKLRKKQQQQQQQQSAQDAALGKAAAAGKKAADPKDVPGLNKEQKDVLQGLTLNIRNLHVRYEDDYFAGDTPYSCGVVIDSVSFKNAELRLFFDSLSTLDAKRSDLPSFAGQLCKDLKLKGLRFYWNCMSEMYIPTSLWESTRHMKYQIFEAMDAQQLNEMMVQVFQERGQSQFQIVLDYIDFDAQLLCYDHSEHALVEGQTRSMTCLTAKASPLKAKLNAQVLSDLQHLVERIRSQFLLRDLKQYRPHRRPITEVPEHLVHNPVLKRKRKLIVRDWFFFVVWYVRLRKIIHSYFQREGKSSFLLFDPKYTQLLRKVLHKETSLEDLVKQIRQTESALKPMWPFKTELNVRMPSVALQVFQKHLFEASLSPKLSLHVDGIGFNMSQGGVPSSDRPFEEKLNLAAQVNSLELNTYHEKTVTQMRHKPLQLSPMLLTQQVVSTSAFVPSQNPSKGGRPPVTPLKGSISSLVAGGYGQKPSGAPQSQSFMRRDYQSNSTTVDNPAAFDDVKVALLHSDNDRQMLHSMQHPHGMTSPGRLMIGPKVSTNEILIGPQQRTEFAGAPDDDLFSYRQGSNKPSVLKKSASKDSLMSNMISSVTKFLGGTTRDATNQEARGEVQTSSHAPSSHTSSFNQAHLPTPTMQHVVSADQRTTYKTHHGSQQINNAKTTSRLQSYAQRIAKKNGQSINQLTIKGNVPANPPAMSKTVRGSAGVQVSSKNSLGQPAKARGLESLLKGQKRILGQNRSFHQNANGALATENNHLEMSTILGSVGSIAGDQDEDIIIDSGGRQINYFNNWVDPTRSRIQDGIQNKNHLAGGTHRAPQTRPESVYGDHPGQTSKSPMLGGGSTLGRLLSSSNQKAAATPSNINQQRLSPTNNTAMPQQTQRIEPATRQHALGRLTSDNGLTQQHQTTVAFDSNCVTLPTQPVAKKGAIQVIKERLIHFEGNQDRPALHSEYKLIHEVRLAKEVQADVLLGSKLQVTYSNNALACLSDLIVSTKDQPSFRDFSLMPECLIPKGLTLLLNQDQVQQERAEEKRMKQEKQALISLRDDRLAGNKRSLAQQKLTAVNSQVQKCRIEFKLQGERVYVSFFDDQNRDQVAKFVSPPLSLSLSVNPRTCPSEANFEIFGFQMQQSTDLGVLSGFGSALQSQLEMFANNKSIQKGKIFYDQVLSEQRRKEDEKRSITQWVMRRQSIALNSQFAAGIIDGNARAQNNAMGALEETKKLVSKKVPQKSTKPVSGQAIKPGKSIRKLNSNPPGHGSSGSLLQGLKQKLEQSSIKSSMVSRGLVIEECPSKQMIERKAGDEDDEELPYPNDGESDSAFEDDSHLQEKRETEHSERRATTQTVVAVPRTPLGDTAIALLPPNHATRRVSKQNSNDQNHDTVSLGDQHQLLDLQEIQRHSDQNLIISDQSEMRTNNSNLRQAADLQMNQAFVKLGGVGPTREQARIIDPNLPLRSNTHTDSAGGEAFLNDDNEYDTLQKGTSLESQRSKPRLLDQDEPLMQAPPYYNQEYDASKQSQRLKLNASSAGSDMQVFEDPSIQSGPRQTHNRARLFRPEEAPMKIPHGLPAGPQNEEGKKWKSTRETQNFSLKKGQRQGSNSKLFSAKESGTLPTQKPHKSKSGSEKFTPNHLLSLSKQIGSSQAARDDDSPSIASRPHMERLNSHHSHGSLTRGTTTSGKETNHKQPHHSSIIKISPSKKHPQHTHGPNSISSYQSQKQLQDVMRQSRSSAKNTVMVGGGLSMLKQAMGKQGCTQVAGGKINAPLSP